MVLLLFLSFSVRGVSEQGAAFVIDSVSIDMRVSRVGAALHDGVHLFRFDGRGFLSHIRQAFSQFIPTSYCPSKISFILPDLTLTIAFQTCLRFSSGITTSEAQRKAVNKPPKSYWASPEYNESGHTIEAVRGAGSMLEG